MNVQNEEILEQAVLDGPSQECTAVPEGLSEPEKSPDDNSDIVNESDLHLH